MSLSSIQLDAFLEVAEHLSFSKAADVLCVTQSALSQRIKKLEEQIGQLFVREAKQLTLTHLGYQLLVYCKKKNEFETEFLSQISSTDKLAGTLTIAGTSTTLRTFIMPLMRQFLINYPEVQLDLLERELRELPALLDRKHIDFIISNEKNFHKDLCSIDLGIEQYVLVESSLMPCIQDDVYLDHDAEDKTTLTFLNQQSQPIAKWRQHYLDNIHLIIEAVKIGLGRAVMPKQMTELEDGLSVVAGYQSMDMPVYLHHREQPYYTQLKLAFLRFLGAIED